MLQSSDLEMVTLGLNTLGSWNKAIRFFNKWGIDRDLQEDKIDMTSYHAIPVTRGILSQVNPRAIIVCIDTKRFITPNRERELRLWESPIGYRIVSGSQVVYLEMEE